LAINPLQGKVVLELGAGTGRISRQISPLAGCLIASDISHHMLSFGKEALLNQGADNWHLSLEAHSHLPFKEECADVIIAGWSFCYTAIDSVENWEEALAQGSSEVSRVLRPGGDFIVIESLGTGFESPHPPDVLKDYLEKLDQTGFNSTWIRTDYLFKDITEAKALTAFFFGEAPMPMWETEKGVIVPECTGLWWKSF
jgi:ubiquinone/menaquinone biosynthesis C-methylase UbiE